MGHPLGVLCCLVALSSWGLLQVSGYYQVLDCCVKTNPLPIPPRYVRDYREQHIQEGCPVQATIFITMRGRQLCAPPYAKWVKHLKAKLDRQFYQRSSWTPS